MPRQIDHKFLAYDGRVFGQWDDCFDYEIVHQLTQLGMTPETINAVRSQADIFIAHGDTIRSILKWRGTYGIPLMRGRRQSRRSPKLTGGAD